MTGKATVLVTGASSQIGVFLLPRLEAAGFRVLAVSRQAPSRPVKATESVSWLHPDHEAARANSDVTFLVSCGPLDLACRAVENGTGLCKSVVFSTSSLHTKLESPDSRERELLQGIVQGEGRLKSLCQDQSVDLVLVRPTLVYGCGLDRNLSLLLNLGERTGLIPVSSKATGLRQPVHADDLAALAVNALNKETGPLLEGEACGGSTLTYREMVDRLAKCGSRPIRPLSLPPGLFKALVRSASLLGTWKSLNPEMVRRQSSDMTFDDTPFREILDYAPRPFTPSADDFKIPSTLKKFRLPL